jgi:hypothetical protein
MYIPSNVKCQLRFNLHLHCIFNLGLIYTYIVYLIKVYASQSWFTN